MQCPCCLDEIDQDTLEVTECNHRFHQACLQRWLEENNTCPLCRHELQHDEEEDGEIDDGFDEDPFEIVYYNVAEMLPIYDIFQAIMWSKMASLLNYLA